MNEEEKKAIEWLNNRPNECTNIIRSCSYIGSKKAYAKERTMYKILINLIEKQAKEIRDNYFLYIKEKNNYDKLLVLYEKQQKEIESLKESNKSFKQQYNQQVLENAKIVNFYENDDVHKELYKLRKDKDILEIKLDDKETELQILKDDIKADEKEYKDYLEHISKELNNIAIDQIPIAISELKFNYEKEIEYLKGIAKKFNEGTNLNDTEMDYVIKIYERKNND